jgi:hypothetical protein
MTNLKKALALLAVLSLPLLPACGKPGEPDNPEDELPTSEELNISAEPTFLEFRHVVGQSPCPQLVGRITLRNRGTSPVTTDVRVRLTAPLSFTASSPTVQPGGTVTIDVFFTCTSQQSFLVTVDTLRENPAQQARDTLPAGSFNVSGIIVR